MAFGYLLTQDRAVLCDDTGAAHAVLKRLGKEKRWRENSPGRFFCEFLEQLLVRDLHHLEELEDQLSQLEDGVLAGKLEGFSTPFFPPLRKQILVWLRYYTQLDGVACELESNESGLFSSEEQQMFHMLEKRLTRLRDEAQLLREYCLQVRELFQAELDIRQNPHYEDPHHRHDSLSALSLVAGWYGMNFTGMPELGWDYGYPAVIVGSVIVVLLTLWIMKKKSSGKAINAYRNWQFKKNCPIYCRHLSGGCKAVTSFLVAVVNVHRFTRMLFFYDCPGVSPQRCFAHSPRRKSSQNHIPIRTVIQL